MNDTKLKTLVKEAVEEVFEEKNDILYKLIEEVIEDMGLIRAIKEGEKTELVDREQVFKILEGK